MSRDPATTGSPRLGAGNKRPAGFYAAPPQPGGQLASATAAEGYPEFAKIIQGY